MVEFSKVVVVELPDDKLVNPFSGNIDPGLIANILSMNFKGVILADGTWGLEPAAGWTVSKVDVGKYTVVHQLGWENTSLSVSTVMPGHIMTVEHSPTSFTVQLSVNGSPQDGDWLFTLARHLKQPRAASPSGQP